MKSGLFIIILLIAGAAANAQTSAPARDRTEASHGPAMPPFETYKILLERNIFNPGRQPYRGDDRPTTTTLAPATERVGLAGVLINKGEALAFFEGSETQYNATVKLGETIAGQRLIEIRTDRVLLAANQKKTELPVAWELHRIGAGNWEATTRTVTLETGPAATDTATTATTTTTTTQSGEKATRPDQSDRSDRSERGSRRWNRDRGETRASPSSETPTPTPSAAQEELLKRMMERRRRETE